MTDRSNQECGNVVNKQLLAYQMAFTTLIDILCNIRVDVNKRSTARATSEQQRIITESADSLQSSVTKHVHSCILVYRFNIFGIYK